MRKTMLGLAIIAGLSAPATLAAQEAPPAPELGEVAPDFELTGATRFGVLRDPVNLRDFRGKTVVLAFFFRARTKG